MTRNACRPTWAAWALIALVLLLALPPGPVAGSEVERGAPRPAPSMPAGAPVPVGLTLSGTPISVSNDFRGTTISAESRLLPNEAAILNATGSKVLVWPGADAGERVDVLNNTILTIHKSKLTWAPPSTSETQFIALCRQISCEAILEVPGEIDQPSFGAQVVTYTEQTLGFHPAYWEIGNEPERWRHWDVPWDQWNTPNQNKSTIITPSAYAWETHNYTAAMRAVDPTIQILGIAGTGRPQNKIPLSTWINTTIAVDGPELAGVAFHVYTAGTKGAPTLQQFYAYDTGPYSVPGRVSTSRSAISNEMNVTCPSCSDPPIFLTEFGSALSHHEYGNMSRSFPGALSMAASEVQALDLNVANVDVFATSLDTSNSWFSLNGTARPDYTLFAQMLSRLGSESYAATLSTPGGPIYTGSNSSLSSNLYGVATLAPADQNRADLLLVNQNLSTNVSLDPVLPGIGPGTPGELWEWSGVVQYSATNRTTWVTPGSPQPVVISFPTGLPSSWTLPAQTVALFEAYPTSGTPVTFRESGLPAGARWFLTVDGTEQETATANMTFFLTPGTHSITAVPLVLPFGKFTTDPHERMEPFPPATVTVGSSPINLTVPFFAQWSFAYTIVPAGAGTLTSAYAWVNASVPQLVTAIPWRNYVVDRWIGRGHGSYNGAGAVARIDAQGPIHENVTFALGFNASFDEEGLPPGASWTVNVGGVAETSSLSAIVFGEMNGSYDFQVVPPAGYLASPSRSVFSLQGTGTVVRVSFAPIVPLFEVRWEETGLPGGLPWSVWVGGTVLPSSGAWTTGHLGNGTYVYWVPDTTGYQPVNRSGTIDVRGALDVLPVEFEPIVFGVSIGASGVGGSTTWTLRLGGVDVNITGGTAVVPEPNGTYAWSVVSPNGFYAQPNHGTVVISGGAVTLLLAFKPIGGAPPYFDPLVGTVLILTTSACLLIIMIAIAARARRDARRPPPRPPAVRPPLPPPARPTLTPRGASPSYGRPPAPSGPASSPGRR